MSALFLFGGLIASMSASADWQTAAPAEARQIMQRFAHCVVKYEPVLAQRYVLLREDERLPEKEFQRLFDGFCLGSRGGQLQFRQWRSRGALAEALMAKRPAAYRRSTFAGVPALDWSISDQAAGGFYTDLAHRNENLQFEQAEMQLSALGECVARADPPAVFNVLQEKMDSGAEISRLRALAPQIAGCVQRGQKVGFNRTNLRTALALAYFRLVQGAPATLASAGKN